MFNARLMKGEIMNLSRAKMEVGFAVDNFKSNYKNDKSGESIKQSWKFIISQLEERSHSAESKPEAGAYERS